MLLLHIFWINKSLSSMNNSTTISTKREFTLTGISDGMAVLAYWYIYINGLSRFLTSNIIQERLPVAVSYIFGIFMVHFTISHSAFGKKWAETDNNVNYTKKKRLSELWLWIIISIHIHVHPCIQWPESVYPLILTHTQTSYTLFRGLLSEPL